MLLRRMNKVNLAKFILPPSCRAGFTLLEVMITLAIIIGSILFFYYKALSFKKVEKIISKNTIEQVKHVAMNTDIPRTPESFSLTRIFRNFFKSRISTGMQIASSTSKNLLKIDIFMGGTNPTTNLEKLVKK